MITFHQLSSSELLCVHFRHLGYIADTNLHDDRDIRGELIACLWEPVCLPGVLEQLRVRLFQAFYICFNYTAIIVQVFFTCAVTIIASTYNDTFEIIKYIVVSQNMLMRTGLQSFNTVMHNCHVRFELSLETSYNWLAQHCNITVCYFMIVPMIEIFIVLLFSLCLFVCMDLCGLILIVNK